MERLEEKVARLEGLVGSLDGASDAEAVDLLEDSAALLEEVSALLEGELKGAEGEARRLFEAVERLEFGALDREISESENRPDGGP